ncbi:MAG: ribosome silencing factor [Candidatus Omnitrophota bacterium]
MQTKQIALSVKNICEEKKGEDVIILDVRKISDITSYFVIAHGNSTRHVSALADYIREDLKQKKMKPWHVDGMSEATWVVLDCGDVMVHVFTKDTRKYYNLERLWGDAPRIT